MAEQNIRNKDSKPEVKASSVEISTEEAFDPTKFSKLIGTWKVIVAE